MKRLFPLYIGLLMLVMAVTACRTQSPAPDSATGPGPNILRFDVAAPFTSMNPAEDNVSGSTLIFPLLYSYLFVPDAHGRLQPDLAESWTYEEAARTWTIRLREDAFFHDGRPVTAGDVIASLGVMINKVGPALTGAIERFSPESDHSFCIRLSKNDPAFIEKLQGLEIMGDTTKTDSGKTNPVIGSGPFVFKSRDKEREVVLTADNNYYAGRPALDGVIYSFQPDKEKTWTRLLAGNTDIAVELSPRNFEMTRQYQDRFYFHFYTLGYYSILLYNTLDSLFSDPLVRRALTMAIDRQYIVEKILNGYGRVAAGPMGVDSPFHNPVVEPLSYDPQKAMRDLHQAGWTPDRNGFLEKEGRAFAFTLLVPDETQVEKDVARYIQLCFNDIGIQMDIVSRSFKEVVARYAKNNDFQAVLTEFTCSSRLVENVIRGWLPDKEGKTLAGNFFHPGVTRLLNLAIQAEDPQAGKKYLFQADALISWLQPGSFLYHKTAFDVMSRKFSLARPFMLENEGIHWLRLASPASE